jgi:PleD family two-component response regulator
LLECSPIRQGQYTGTGAYRQTLQDYRKSQQEHRRLIQQFRQTLHKHLIFTRNYRSKQSSQVQVERPLVRKTILLGENNENEAAFLKASLQQACAHRIFLAADSSQVLRLVQNVHIDLLVLDDGLTPLPAIELYHHLHFIKGLKALPAIIMSASSSPLLQAELAHDHLVRIEKPIKVKALVKAIDQLLA